MTRKHSEIKGYRLIADYPGNNKPIGSFEPYTTGEFSKYPHLWKPVLWEDVVRDKKIRQVLSGTIVNRKITNI